MKYSPLDRFTMRACSCYDSLSFLVLCILPVLQFYFTYSGTASETLEEIEVISVPGSKEGSL